MAEVLVTGGDTELGRTIAAGYKDAGHNVVIAGARRDDLEIAAKELDIESIVFDNTDPASPRTPAACSRTTSTRWSTCPHRVSRPRIRAPSRSPTRPRRGATRSMPQWSRPR